MSVEEKIEALEKLMNQKWDDHDKLSQQRHETVNNSLTVINDSLKSLFCVKGNICPLGNEKFKSISGQVNMMWGVIITVIVLGIGLGIWVNGAVKMVDKNESFSTSIIRE